MSELRIVVGEKGTGKTYNRISHGKTKLVTYSSIFLPNGAPNPNVRVYNLEIYVPLSSTDMVDVSAEKTRQRVKAVLALKPKRLVVEVSSFTVAQALHRYFAGSQLVVHTIADTEWYRELPAEQQQLANRFSSLSMAVHQLVLTCAEPEQEYLKYFREEFGIEIVHPMDPFGFFFDWQRRLIECLSSQRAGLVLLVSPPGMAKTKGVECVAKHLGYELLIVDPHALIDSRYGATAERFSRYLDAITRYVSALGHPCVILIDEGDSLFPASKRDTDIAGEVRAVKFKFNRWLEQKDSRAIVVMASNYPLEPSITSRGETIVVSLGEKDLVHAIKYHWQITRSEAQVLGRTMVCQKCIDLRVIAHAKKAYQEKAPTPEQLVEFIQTQGYADERDMQRQQDLTARRIANLERDLRKVATAVSESVKQQKTLAEELRAKGI